MRKGLIVCLVLSACASSRAIIGPDGTPHHLIKSGSIEMCYEKAREVCGGNYEIVNTSTETSGGNDTGVSTSTSLLVKCKK